MLLLSVLGKGSIRPGMAPQGSGFTGPSVASAAASSSSAEFPEVDLSHLSEEERALIESVMVKAQQLEELDTKPTSR